MDQKTLSRTQYRETKWLFLKERERERGALRDIEGIEMVYQMSNESSRRDNELKQNMKR